MMQQLGRVVSQNPGRRFVISDIHGCVKTLQKLLEQIDPQEFDQLFFLGDYINKGPSSRETLDYLISLKSANFETYFIRGNHDQKLITYYETGDEILGDELRGFLSHSLVDISDSERYPYQEFLKSTDFFYISGSHVLVHAGLDFNLNNPFRDKDSMMNVRGFTYDSKKAMGKSILHGHFPMPEAVILQAFESRDRIIPMDNGCVYPQREGMGKLLCIELNSWAIFSQSNLDIA